MDIVERLRGDYSDERLEIAADEIERLREDKNLYAETIYELEKDIRVKDHEIERLREALARIEEIGEHVVWPVTEMRNTAMRALQGKEFE